nr:MAG TPA: Photosystem II protein D1 [Caudoviricetes sp.]
MFCHIMTVYSVSFCVFLNVILYNSLLIQIFNHLKEH